LSLIAARIPLAPAHENDWDALNACADAEMIHALQQATHFDHRKDIDTCHVSRDSLIGAKIVKQFLPVSSQPNIPGTFRMVGMKSSFRTGYWFMALHEKTPSAC
jgi:hypothetical protein